MDVIIIINRVEVGTISWKLLMNGWLRTEDDFAMVNLATPSTEHVNGTLSVDECPS